MNFRRFLLLVVVLIMAIVLAGCPLLDEFQAGPQPESAAIQNELDGNLEVHIIDVGQGDAQVIITPCERVVKIDGGDNHTRQYVIDYLNSIGISHIDVVVTTHPHADHIGGLIGVLDEFSIGVVYRPEVPVELQPDTQTLRRFNEVIAANEIEVRYAVAGYVLQGFENVAIKVLSPSNGEYSRLNEHSIVLSVTYGNTRAIFTGDAYQSNERWILGQDFGLSACILVLGHHGSNTSSYGGFLSAVNPDFAIVSAAAGNRHGHPHAAVVERVASYTSANLLRTYEVGTIVAVSDGASFTVAYQN